MVFPDMFAERCRPCLVDKGERLWMWIQRQLSRPAELLTPEGRCKAQEKSFGGIFTGEQDGNGGSLVVWSRLVGSGPGRLPR